MNEHNCTIGASIESAIRMLGAARAELRSDHGEDTAEFLRAAERRIGSALKALDGAGTVVQLPREKTNAR